MEADHKPTREPQRQLNNAMREVVKKEVLKLLHAGIIYPVSDSEWLSKIRTISSYHKEGGCALTTESLMPPPGKIIFLFLSLMKCWKDWQNTPSATSTATLDTTRFHSPRGLGKTTFTCPCGTFSYRRMSFGLCNAPASFQRCMMAIFSDFIKDIMEVFMDDFSVYGKSFDGCLENLEKVLKRCQEVDLVMN
ncbi:hypothetical protein U9M48_039763 [Paspalum notatum var. saurae]|uniref:Reverse transcriptase domain-containing protein n=1 Tax=Paspalum notatum var. saurae TaxID=547442 RepID=A0AAQ3XCG9_PASNO